MKRRILLDGHRYRCQYKKWFLWWNFKDRRLNPRSNLNVWFANWESAALWMTEKEIYD